MLTLLATGMLAGLALIVAIGAQNAYVLRQGLARDHVGTVVVICTVSDVVLIAAGVAGIGVLVEQAGWALVLIRWLGVAFLTWYGVSSLLRARRGGSLRTNGGTAGRRTSVAVKALALTWLNPHVYLDTVILLGSIANTHGADGRWWFGAGAMVASALWFGVLGFGAHRAHGLLATERAWRVLDVLIGLTMLGIAVSLAQG
ncbi:LysE/ArgO family amino acid transporter [Nocardioides sp. GCM10027113]|uniref:LysE/ArgO family amino acid transporter n=1 Tax=unclassified Nocardioides TaxID=2615069 RepID=UPI00362142C1